MILLKEKLEIMKIFNLKYSDKSTDINNAATITITSFWQEKNDET